MNRQRVTRLGRVSLGTSILCCVFALVTSDRLAPKVNGQEQLPRIKYNDQDLVVDLGVGLWSWPLPMDYDQDGDMDLVVMCPDKPYRGTYFFENQGDRFESIDSSDSSPTWASPEALPIFAPAIKIADAQSNVQLSMLGERPIVVSPEKLFANFRESQFAEARQLPITTRQIHDSARIRANQWKVVDWDNDGTLDLLVGIGDWEAYGWDNAFDDDGNWTRGPLHGFVYFIRNVGTHQEPEFAEPQQLRAGGEILDVYGMPSPNAADFDGDGDLDLICGEFLDGFTYFENVGDRDSPSLAAGRRLAFGDDELAMDLQMIVPVSIDWDRDGDIDLVVGDEDGRVALVVNTGELENGVPTFLPPHYFRQQAADVKFGALVTPVSVDWDDDGDDDLICGNTAGYFGFIENLDGGNPPRWAEPKYLTANGEIIRIQAGPNGSIQGPCEAKWGYTTLSVADWDHDGQKDIIFNSIWGKVQWLRNVGQTGRPELSEPETLEVRWTVDPPKPAWNWWSPEGNELSTQWRTTPIVADWNGDGLNDLISLDHEGYLVLFERDQDEDGMFLLPPMRCFYGSEISGYDSAHRTTQEGEGLLRLNTREAGASGRRKMCLCDWDGDGLLDLMINSRSVHWLRQLPLGEQQDGSHPKYVFSDQGPVTEHVLAGHTTSPTQVDWDGDDQPDLLIGAEDGFFYYLERE